MSLISGLYFRGAKKQKPNQWGPKYIVKSVIKDRLHNIGIPYSDLALYLPCWSPGIPIDYSQNNMTIIEPINYKASFLNNALVAGPTVNGYAIGSSITPPDAISFSGNDDITVLCDIDFSTLSSSGWCVAQSSEIVLRKSTSAKCEFILNSFTTNDRASTISNIPSSGHGIIGGFYRAGKNKIGSFCNNDVNTLTPTGTYGGVSDEFCFFGGTYNSTSFSLSNGKIFQLMIFRRGLSNNDILFFADNPYYLIQPPTARTYFDMISAGTSIECSVGAVAVTGLPAEITAGTSIECSVGAVAVTGLPAEITAWTSIDCSVGAVAITGLPAEITAWTSIDCSVGAVAVTGLPAEITAGTSIDCSVGAVAVTGLPAEITAGTSIDCSVGAVAVTGLFATILTRESVAPSAYRSFTVKNENRSFTVKNENRSFTII